VLFLDSALAKLKEKSPRQAQVVELKYFGGLSVEQIASTLDVAPRSVKRDWSLARMFLYRELNPGAALPESDSGDEPDGQER
jgi:RNA polymerase sigma-70 factor (ECF subfamily)